MVKKALLFVRTLRNLRTRQLVHLPIRRLQRGRPPRSACEAAVASERWDRLAVALPSLIPVFNERFLEVAYDVVERRFRFGNHSEVLPEIDWSHQFVSPLWTYNLHYFDYALNLALAHDATGDEKYVCCFEDLVQSWIRSTAHTSSAGWDPYTISLRVPNWLYSMLLLGGALRPEVADAMRKSVATQLGVLERRLEWHLLGNHLLANLKALLLGGIAFEGDAPSRWWRKGAELLDHQLSEQVLPDGMHIERSPMYHAIVLRDLLELFHLSHAAGKPVSSITPSLLGRMAEAGLAMTRADGSLHLLHDSANGVAPSAQRIASLIGTLAGAETAAPQSNWSLPRAGYFGFRDSRTGDGIIVDAGSPGPSYQPGHAHCSLLSYELEVNGESAVVDSGLSGYEGDPLREYVRSTRAHNTVVIAGREQSEVWGTFRMARRARVLRAHASGDTAAFRFEGVFTPYFDSDVTHRRIIERSNTGWTITDTVSGCDGAVLHSFVHLHPAFTAELEDGQVIASSGRTSLKITPFGFAGVALRRGEEQPYQGWYCPELGRRFPASVVELTGRAGATSMGYTIVGQDL